MSKYNTIEVWNKFYGKKEDVTDYAGRKMKRSACGNPNSDFHPTLDHIRPLSAGGSDVLENIEICHRTTNEEKGDDFPHWKTNGKRFKAVRVKGNKNAYKIIPD
jgi:5-methylcytosine-specific restriction endonuclease McrA